MNVTSWLPGLFPWLRPILVLVTQAQTYPNARFNIPDFLEPSVVRARRIQGEGPRHFLFTHEVVRCRQICDMEWNLSNASLKSRKASAERVESDVFRRSFGPALMVMVPCYC